MSTSDHIAPIGSGDLDPTSFKLPEYVKLCGVCNGRGAFKQHYREGRFTGPCHWCGGLGMSYGAGFMVGDEPASASVVNQILVANKARRVNQFSGWQYLPEESK